MPVDSKVLCELLPPELTSEKQVSLTRSNGARLAKRWHDDYDYDYDTRNAAILSLDGMGF